jgi:hypothetical protein
MKRFITALAATFAVAAPAAQAATPVPDYVPAPHAIQTSQAGTRVVQLNDGGGGLPYLGGTKSYNAGDWEPNLIAYAENGTPPVYASEISLIDNLAEQYALKAARQGPKHGHKGHHHGRAAHHGRGHTKPAIVLDIDETALSNYGAIKADNFTFGTNSQAEATEETGKAIPQTLKFFNDAKAAGISVFFITGRREVTRAHTESNLTREGYAGWKQLYLKPDASTQTTIQYKTGARKDIESQGYRIVANVGDQFSDLIGGHAQKAFKLPNHFYFLP